LKFTFKYRREEAKKRIIYRPVVKLSLKSTDARWYTFTAYVDSGADVSMLPKGDAKLLGIGIYSGRALVYLYLKFRYFMMHLS